MIHFVSLLMCAPPSTPKSNLPRTVRTGRTAPPPDCGRPAAPSMRCSRSKNRASAGNAPRAREMSLGEWSRGRNCDAGAARGVARTTARRVGKVRRTREDVVVGAGSPPVPEPRLREGRSRRRTQGRGHLVVRGGAVGRHAAAAGRVRVRTRLVRSASADGVGRLDVHLPNRCPHGPAAEVQVGERRPRQEVVQARGGAAGAEASNSSAATTTTALRPRTVTRCGLAGRREPDDFAEPRPGFRELPAGAPRRWCVAGTVVWAPGYSFRTSLQPGVTSERGGGGWRS